MTVNNNVGYDILCSSEICLNNQNWYNKIMPCNRPFTIMMQWGGGGVNVSTKLRQYMKVYINKHVLVYFFQLVFTFTPLTS